MTASNLDVAKTILEQLGGNRFLLMTGSYNLVGSSQFLKMNLRRNKSHATHLKITLTPADTYTMEFIKLSSTVRTFEDVYSDQLQDIFTSVTGLDTHL